MQRREIVQIVPASGVAAVYRGAGGAMAPTDDVIAHLMLMRGDEPKFWAKANHHPIWKAEAGL